MNQWNVYVTSPEERQSDQPTWVPTLLSTCGADLEEVSGHECELQTRRQLLKTTSNQRHRAMTIFQKHHSAR